MGNRSSINRLRARRTARGVSQTALAEAVGLSRQSVHAIEAMRAVPSVDIALALAHALECSVEALFGERSTDDTLVTAEAAEGAVTGRVALAHIDERWCAYGLGPDNAGLSADGIAGQHAANEVELLRPISDCRQNIALMGCSPALGLLADRLNARPGPGRFLWFARSSTKALSALALGKTHLAGVHLVDGATGEANLPDIRRQVSDRDLVVVTLGRWQAGLVVRAGNPRRISDISALAHKRTRLIQRERGSGARRLLEREAKRAGVERELESRSVLEVLGHLDVARAVALGVGDVGIATRDAALAHGLGFIALEEERYDVVVARKALEDERVARLFEVMESSAFRRELSATGYDVETCGERVAEIRAA